MNIKDYFNKAPRKNAGRSQEVVTLWKTQERARVPEYLLQMQSLLDRQLHLFLNSLKETKQ